MQYRRAKVDGGTYFFTLVTHNRRQFLCEPDNVSLLRNAFRYVIKQHPFKIDAFVLLPDHLELIRKENLKTVHSSFRSTLG